jgi:hypothetical protein
MRARCKCWRELYVDDGDGHFCPLARVEIIGAPVGNGEEIVVTNLGELGRLRRAMESAPRAVLTMFAICSRGHRTYVPPGHRPSSVIPRARSAT